MILLLKDRRIQDHTIAMLSTKKTLKDKLFMIKIATGAPPIDHEDPDAPAVPNLPEQGVYVLLLTHKEIYVGKSKDIAKRIEQHKAGTGNGFARNVVKRIPTKTPPLGDWESWERAETLHWMRAKGIEKVRGWMYTGYVMSPEDQEHARQQICERYDLCRKCSKPGHFIKDCV